MCNLYNTANPAAFIELTRALRDLSGNLQPACAQRLNGHDSLLAVSKLCCSVALHTCRPIATPHVLVSARHFASRRLQVVSRYFGQFRLFRSTVAKSL